MEKNMEYNRMKIDFHIITRKLTTNITGDRLRSIPIHDLDLIKCDLEYIKQCVEYIENTLDING